MVRGCPGSVLGLADRWVTPQDNGGWTPIIWAAEHKHIEVIRRLLTRGADVTLTDNVSHGGTPGTAGTPKRLLCPLRDGSASPRLIFPHPKLPFLPQNPDLLALKPNFPPRNPISPPKIRVFSPKTPFCPCGVGVGAPGGVSGWVWVPRGGSLTDRAPHPPKGGEHLPALGVVHGQR